MKRFILLFSLLAGICLNGFAQSMRLVPSEDDSTRMDTVVVSTLSDVEEEADDTSYSSVGVDLADDFNFHWIALVTIIMIFGLPVFIVGLVLWFRYKNKQAKYRLAAEALAQGKEIPREFYKGNSHTSQNQEVLTKGIRNIFLGIGLGVFFWMLTGEEGITAIGFLIFCMGVGQVIIAYATRPKDHDNSPTDIERR